MASARSLHARVARLEQAGAPLRSPIERWFGSLEAFELETQVQVDAGALDRRDLYGADGNSGVMRAIRSWHEQGLFGTWKRDRIWERRGCASQPKSLSALE